MGMCSICLRCWKALDAREERMRETYYQYRLVNDKRWLKVMLRGAKDSDGLFGRWCLEEEYAAGSENTQ